MSRYRIIVAVCGVALAWCAAPLAITHAAQLRAGGAAWGKAIEVPDLAALNAGTALLVSVSCASAGNCLVGGSYQDRRYGGQAFVASERSGRWGKAIEVPGTADLNTGGSASVNSVSCASAGNCTAGGFYTQRVGKKNFGQAFVASERNGRWGKAIEVPGTGALNVAGNAQVVSVSCGSAGNCTAGGFYFARSSQQPFVASERNGRWGKAIEVPGMATLTVGVFGFNQVYSVSCASAGNCTAGGQYTDGSMNTQAFVASQRHGRWRKAIEVPGTATLNTGGLAQVSSVSCASAGNCTAGGSYRDGSGNTQAFVAGQRHGRWRKAIKVPGTAALNTGGFAAVNSVSCASAGNCVTGGYYERRHRARQAFVASQRNGRWRTAIEVPGTGALNAGRDAQVVSVSCASAGNCAAGGYYSDRSFNFQAFVATQRNGRWRKAIEVPGTATLNAGLAQIYSVSCVPAGSCAAGGSYTDRHGHAQGFVVSRS